MKAWLEYVDSDGREHTIPMCSCTFRGAVIRDFWVTTEGYLSPDYCKRLVKWMVEAVFPAYRPIKSAKGTNDNKNPTS